MPRAGAGPDFIEALARGLEVIAAFRPGPAGDDARRGRRRDRAWPGRPPAGSCSRSRSSATSAPTAAAFALTPRVLDLGVAYVRSHGPVGGRPPAPGARWCARTDESCSVAQLDGSDIVYVARVAVPKIVGAVGADRHPVPGAADVAGQGAARRAARATSWTRVLAEPTRSGLIPRWQPDRAERDAALREVRARGWALTDEQLALGHPVGRRPAARRDGPGDRGGQRQRARRGDVGGAPRSSEHLPLLLRRGRARSAPTSPRLGPPQVPCHGDRRLRLTVARSDSCPHAGERRANAVPRPGRSPGCSSPTSPGSSPARTPRCCSPTWAPRWSRSSARAATTPAPGRRPVRDGVSTYYLGINRNKRSIALDLRDDGRPRAGPRARPPGRRADRELQARRAGQVRPRLRQPSAPPTPGVVYASISGFGTGDGRATCPATT